MDRYWLLTWICYGQWLPGDPRGFVGNIREDDGTQINHNIPGTPYEADHPGLEVWVRGQMCGDPISLSRADAEATINQFRKTARIRKICQLHAYAFSTQNVMPQPHKASLLLVRHLALPSVCRSSATTYLSSPDGIDLKLKCP